jgi:hypothetical protein
MKAIEFKTRLKHQSIQVPDDLSSIISKNKDVRVIILFDEEAETDSYKNMVNEEFLEGYSNSDSIYDDY